jgi:hypothetical protein
VAIAAGFAAAALFPRSQLDYTPTPPTTFVTVGLAVSLTLIASTVPPLRRVTGPAAARNE